MIIRILLLSLLAFIITSCGIPKETQEAMRESLQDDLNESFINDSIVLPYKISLELTDIQKDGDNGTGDYKASFKFSFQDFWDKSGYEVRGVAYFDKDGYIIKTNGKKNIRINIISKDYKLVSAEELINLRPKDILGWCH